MQMPILDLLEVSVKVWSSKCFDLSNESLGIFLGGGFPGLGGFGGSQSNANANGKQNLLL